MPINIPTIINELRENATEEQRKELNLLENRFYECIELKKDGAELVQKMHILKNTIGKLGEQLKEANEVIKFYSDAHQLTEEEKQMTGEKYHLVYGLKANNYLEKWDVK